MAAHEDVIPVDELYAICQTARGLLVGEHGVGRVIARPFVGEPGSFDAPPHAKDFSLAPPEPTLLDHAVAAGIEVVAVGKVTDIFAARGITRSLPRPTTTKRSEATLHALDTTPGPSLIFANCVDFDTIEATGTTPRVRQGPGGLRPTSSRAPAGALPDGDAFSSLPTTAATPPRLAPTIHGSSSPFWSAGSRIQTGVDLGLAHFRRRRGNAAQGLAIDSRALAKASGRDLSRGDADGRARPFSHYELIEKRGMEALSSRDEIHLLSQFTDGDITDTRWPPS